MDTRQLMTSTDTKVLRLDVPHWYTDAACKGVAVDEFFPEQAAHGRPAAVALCEDCPVRVECLEYALDRPSLLGWWGGLGARERQRLRRAQRQRVA